MFGAIRYGAAALVLGAAGCGAATRAETSAAETSPSPVHQESASSEVEAASYESEQAERPQQLESTRYTIPTPLGLQIYRLVEETAEAYQLRRDAILDGANPGEEAPLLRSEDIHAIVPTADAEACTLELTTDAQVRLSRWHQAATGQSFVAGLIGLWGDARHQLYVDGVELRGPCPQGPPPRRLGTTGVLIDMPASFQLNAGGAAFRFTNEADEEVAIIYPADETHVEGLRNGDASTQVRVLPIRPGVVAIQRTTEGQVSRFIVLQRATEFWVCTSSEAHRYCDSLRAE